MKSTITKNTTVKELEKRLADEREGLRRFYFKAAGSKITNVKEARGRRRDIARILTQLRASEKTK